MDHIFIKNITNMKATVKKLHKYNIVSYSRFKRPKSHQNKYLDT